VLQNPDTLIGFGIALSGGEGNRNGSRRVEGCGIKGKEPHF